MILSQKRGGRFGTAPKKSGMSSTGYRSTMSFIHPGRSIFIMHPIRPVVPGVQTICNYPGAVLGGRFAVTIPREVLLSSNL